MTIALVAHTQTAGGLNTSSSPAINTTGADFIVFHVSWRGGPVTLSDSKSNIWTSAVDSGAAGGFNHSQIFYSQNPTVGTSHTFTVTGTSIYSIAEILAFSGVATSSVLDITNSAVDASGLTSFQPGSVTPSQANSVIVTGLSSETTSSNTINLSFAITDQAVISFGQYYSAATAYLVQGAATAVNPTWANTAVETAASIAVFKPAGAATSGLFLPPSLNGLGSGGSFFTDRLAA